MPIIFTLLSLLLIYFLVVQNKIPMLLSVYKQQRIPSGCRVVPKKISLRAKQGKSCDAKLQGLHPKMDMPASCRK